NLFSATYERVADANWVLQGRIDVLPADLWLAGLQSQDTVSGPGVENVAQRIAGRCRVLDAEMRIPQAVWIARLGIQTAQAGTTGDLGGVEPMYFGRSSAEIQWEKLHAES